MAVTLLIDLLLLITAIYTTWRWRREAKQNASLRCDKHQLQRDNDFRADMISTLVTETKRQHSLLTKCLWALHVEVPDDPSGRKAAAGRPAEV